MNLTLKVTAKEGTNMSNLVKRMCTLKCLISVDSEAGTISIVEIDEKYVESVIDAINDAFNITRIDIIPTVDSAETEEKTVSKKTAVTQNSPGPKKVEFSDAEIEEQINKLIQVSYRAMSSVGAKPKDICNYIKTASEEITMKYNPLVPVKCKIGDVIDCNYGSHLKGEISGENVPSIVCDIDPCGLLYVVPIVKRVYEDCGEEYIPLIKDIDVKYIYPKYMGGNVLIGMGRYINHHRVNGVIGHVFPNFFEGLLESIPYAVDFSYNLDKITQEENEQESDVDDDDNMLEFEGVEELKETIETEMVDDTTVAEETTEESAEEAIEESVEETNSDLTDKKVSAEEYISEIISEALESLDNSKSAKSQIDEFLVEIGFSNVNKYVKQAFISACVVKKIGYDSIITDMYNVFKDVHENTIKAALKEEFKEWLEDYPDIKEKYPKVSIMSLLKIFAKKMA